MVLQNKSINYERDSDNSIKKIPLKVSQQRRLAGDSMN
jgi:hypothetical protein